MRSTYRHELTVTAASAAPSIPYVCTRPYRAPELFYGAECYRGEPDGTRARARVRACLLPLVHQSIPPCRVRPFSCACVRVDVRGGGPRRTQLQPHRAHAQCGPSAACSATSYCAAACSNQRAPPTPGVYFEAPQLATRAPLGCEGPAWATLHTPAARRSVPHRLTAHRLGLRTVGAASSSSMPRGSTATRCCAKRRRAPRAPRSSTCCTAASAHQRSRWAYRLRADGVRVCACTAQVYTLLFAVHVHTVHVHTVHVTCTPTYLIAYYSL